jgi:chemotaxis protein CheC
MEFEITDVEKDIIKEILNIGLAKAADSFAIIARQNVILNVPSVEVTDANELGNILGKSRHSDTVIKSVIMGDLKGKTYIVFTEDQANKLAAACFGSETSYQGNFNFMKRSLLLETSNILTGSILTQLANILDKKIYGKIPTLVPYSRRREPEEYLEELDATKQFVMTVVTKFTNLGTQIELPLMVVFELASVSDIVQKIRREMESNTNWMMA